MMSSAFVRLTRARVPLGEIGAPNKQYQHWSPSFRVISGSDSLKYRKYHSSRSSKSQNTHDSRNGGNDGHANTTSFSRLLEPKVLAAVGVFAMGVAVAAFENHEDKHEERANVANAQQEANNASEPPPLEPYANEGVPDLENVQETNEEDVDTALGVETQAEDKVEGVEDEYKEYKYVIVGGGVACAYAIKKILANDPEAQILVISEENTYPHRRAQLSKQLFVRSTPEERKQFAFHDNEGRLYGIQMFGEDVINEMSDKVTWMLGKKVIDVRTLSKLVVTDDGQVISFDKVLLATGSHPKPLDKANVAISKDALEKVHNFHTLEDFVQLNEVSDQNGAHILVVGGNALASELACNVAYKGRDNGIKVTQVLPETGSSTAIAEFIYRATGIMSKTLPQYLSQYVTNIMQQKYGVDMKTERKVVSVTKDVNTNKLLVNLDDHSSLEADYVVSSVGNEVDVDICFDLEVDPKHGGFVVNPQFEAVRDIYVAGDIASYYDITLGARRRVEQHLFAAESGRIAGHNMSTTGKRERYMGSPIWWTELGTNIRFEGIGLTDSSLKTVGVWERPDSLSLPDTAGKTEPLPPPATTEHTKGILYYLNNDNKIVGVVLMNIVDRTTQAGNIVRDEYFVKPNKLHRLKNLISLESFDDDE